MECRNVSHTNNTSFGMAFIKPDDMESFTKYVTKNYDASTIKKGIQQLRREQKNNKHFDIKYSQDDVILLKPKTPAGEAVSMTLSYKKNMDGRLTPLQKIQKSVKDDLDLAEQSGSKLKLFASVSKALFQYVRMKIIKTVNPKYSLPNNLIFAAEDATMLEKTAERRLRRNTLIEDAFKN